MKSGKQRRAELDAKKKVRFDEAAAERRKIERASIERAAARGALVDRAALAPNGSYNRPEFVKRGYYSDQPFDCIDCGKSEVWTAKQQKWWYEVAKGDIFTIARRCRDCRRKDRVRRANEQRKPSERL